MSLIHPDPVHGLTELPDYVRQVMQTAQFQRLRNVSQMGACQYVFDGTNHSRFEHCVGVSILVAKFLDILERNSGQRANEFYRKCVVLAGLMHDVGHGPYSHMWEHFVHGAGDKKWLHENTSCDVVRYLIKQNSIRLAVDDNDHDTGVSLIVALIGGDVDTCHQILGDDHFYLSEIVNNKFCLIDVDKWDYLARDSHYARDLTTIKPNFDKCFKQAKVVRDLTGNRTHISFAESTRTNIYELFENRATLHKFVYQRDRVLAVELILLRIFQLADEAGFLFMGVRLGEAQHHMNVFQHLDDRILNTIECSDDPRLAETQKYIKIIRNNQFKTTFDSNTETVEVTFYTDDLREQRLTTIRHLPTVPKSLPQRILLHNGNDVLLVHL